MRVLAHLGSISAGVPLLADDVLEFHASRLLLLIQVCGIGNKIDGLTKLAKLDFFVRYPRFFATVRAQTELGHDAGETSPQASTGPAGSSVESTMVRYRYGPWDMRYYHILAYLEAKDLVTVEPHGGAYRFVLTALGQDCAKQLSSLPSFEPLIDHMSAVKASYRNKSGAYLKNIIYKVLQTEIAEQPLGATIEP